MISSVLTVVSDTEEIAGALKKASAIARSQANLHLAFVVYEGITDFKAKQVDAAGLKELLIEDAQADLEDAIKASGYANVDYRVVWHMNQWQGVLAAADDVKADLIVKQSDAEHVRQFSFYTPDDWNLLRHALVPVLLMRPRPWPTKPIVIAAIDTYDFEHTALNHSILQTAQDACTRLQANLQIASVFPPLTIWLDRFQVAENYVGIRADIEDEIFNDIARLANEQHITRYRPRALEGMAAPTLAALATSEGASLLVMGTNARSGVEGFIIGNTAEKILNAMPCDVLTIPPPRANTATQEA
jgi:universal stress protein E